MACHAGIANTESAGRTARVALEDIAIGASGVDSSISTEQPGYTIAATRGGGTGSLKMKLELEDGLRY